MPLLGTNLSQQLGFTVTTTAGTIYTHGLGFTPTMVLLTAFGTAQTGTVPIGYFYTLANSVTITIGSTPSTGVSQGVDVLCGRLHSIIQ